jgi:hypothetical protein
VLISCGELYACCERRAKIGRKILEGFKKLQEGITEKEITFLNLILQELTFIQHLRQACHSTLFKFSLNHIPIRT